MNHLFGQVEGRLTYKALIARATIRKTKPSLGRNMGFGEACGASREQSLRK
jgi:hypothetical protein